MRLQWIHHAWNPQMHIKILSVAFLFCSYSTVLVIWQVFNNYFQLFVQLLCCFSCVRSCATPETAAHQAPPSLGLSRQERWSGLPIPSPILFLTICHLTRNGSSTTRSHAWGQMTIQAMQVASLLLNINKSNHFSPWHYHIYYTTYFTYLIC